MSTTSYAEPGTVLMKLMSLSSHWLLGSPLMSERTRCQPASFRISKALRTTLACGPAFDVLNDCTETFRTVPKHSEQCTRIHCQLGQLSDHVRSNSCLSPCDLADHSHERKSGNLSSKEWTYQLLALYCNTVF